LGRDLTEAGVNTALVAMSWLPVYCWSRERDIAGGFALDLLNRLCGAPWADKESNVEPNLRIALYAGPVFTRTDHVTGQSSATGLHAIRTVRIEPITPSGQVYASQAFAALAAAGIGDFTCDYVGEIPLAKEPGTYPNYHVCRRS